MSDIDLPATKLRAVQWIVAYATMALMILWGGWTVLAGTAPEWALRVAAFWLLGLLFNRVMRVLLAAIGVWQAIGAVEKHARRTQR